MCLAIPAKIVSVDGVIAKVDMMGNERIISIDLVPEAGIGDYVLVHAGFAIGVIDNQSAKETEELLLEVADAYAEGE
ncbi:HypC/HybG/HupF family hydrogenase formation chaperone [Desulfosporosinus sp. FKB]|uniref:HypC/HybG/HupF family hydrogenase formation chaperone n=1 Tax=unclassified Desulfosporosinus TaxID=2633794 RepID=UPI000B49E6BF|nr:HypC/HybG/HupF family hydrogenase formation chaperone [Desulfosporosinus sp. FKB]